MNPVQFSGRTAKSFLVNVLRLVVKKACDQDLTHFLDTSKNISAKLFPKFLFAICVAYDTAYAR